MKRARKLIPSKPSSFPPNEVGTASSDRHWHTLGFRLADIYPVCISKFRRRGAPNGFAGGEWPKRARRAAVILTDRRAIEPSDGVRLLVSLDPLITKATAEGRNWLTSQEIVTGLKANPDAEWREYRGKSPITERQIAWLLRQYEGRANRCVRGYRLDQFNEPTRRFAHRYMAEVPPDPLIHSSADDDDDPVSVIDEAEASDGKPPRSRGRREQMSG